jgi:hypothetical protein
MKNTLTAAVMAPMLMLAAVNASADVSLDAQVDYEMSGYFNDKAQSSSFQTGVDQRINNSVSLELKIFSAWDDGAQSISFKPFYRQDEMDKERSHGDVRELLWNKLADEYELKVGLGKVFWGVTESAHLVDIINQTDSVEGIDGEQKLGQPMVQVLLEREWGNLDLFVLPYFRERTFAGADARLSPGLDYADARYESSDEESNVDVAARWSHYWEELEYAVSVFHGNSRDPIMGFDFTKAKFFLYYPEITQLGVELQFLDEGWAWKFEGVIRDGVPGGVHYGLLNNFRVQNSECSLNGSLSPCGIHTINADHYFATAAGFEYTQVGIFETRIDLGWVAEHIYDSRQEKAGFGAFEHDVLLATRWAANDDADSTLLAGVVYDYEYQDYSLSIEGNTRLFDGVSLALEARVFAPSSDNVSQYAFRDEDFVKLTLSYYL